MKTRNAARRQSRGGINGGRVTGGSLGAIARTVVIPRFSWPPPNHPTLHRIGRKGHRIFAAELVRHTRAGDSYDAILLAAMRAAFPRSKRVGDEAMREKGRRLAFEPHILEAVLALLDERR